MTTQKWRLGSMYSGCGGFDLGLKRAGFELTWANDIDTDACKTYRENLGDIIEGDVNNIDPTTLAPIDVLAAGFPCQPFSNAGRRRGTSDSRGTLYKNTFDFIKVHAPKIVVYENVRGFLSFKGAQGKLIDEIADSLRNEFGYYTSYKLINMSHFGVPQNRIRVVLVAIKDKKYLEHIFPDVTVNQDLSIEKTLEGLTESFPNQNELLPLNPQAIKYGQLIPEGGSWKSLPYEILPERWKKIHDNMQRYHYPNFFRRYSRKDIMGTITAAFKPENAAVWHPIEQRIYSVREIARFQTFPDDYIFYGRSIKSKYQQIGNAVPPLFAELLGKRLIACLQQIDTAHLLKKFPESCTFNVNRPIPGDLQPVCDPLFALA